MAGLDIVWNNCVNQQAQAVIPSVVTLEELGVGDSFTQNEEFIRWCEENYTHQVGIDRIWPITLIQESDLFPNYVDQGLPSINHYVRNSDVKIFMILSYGKTRIPKRVLYLSGSPRIGKELSSC